MRGSRLPGWCSAGHPWGPGKVMLVAVRLPRRAGAAGPRIRSP